MLVNCNLQYICYAVVVDTHVVSQMSKCQDFFSNESVITSWLDVEEVVK